MFVTETLIRVRYAETDQMKIVYHGNFAQYFETARAESVRQLGFTYKEMEEMDIIMPVVEIDCRFLRPAYYDDLLTVRLMLKELPNDHRVEFFHEVFNENKKLLVTGRVVLFFMQASTMQRTVMPEGLREKLAQYFTHTHDS